MSRQPPPGVQVPTLTEVVQLPADGPPAGGSGPATPDSPPSEPSLLRERVFADVQQRLDLVLEQRIRELLAPTLARMADDCILQARAELDVTIRDLVAQAIDRQRSR